ncbi:hypothetical protein HaLaN_27431 [Haematococcus lacustris]|uniref:Uncharacterized protein n=1 Tax=Haematococcus lacustris TaxID=44745 RepID=A0A6A0A850_HAELA|nr:hypothetical protein HaLaN_27431 [Haematococcus lacustris]
MTWDCFCTSIAAKMGRWLCGCVACLLLAFASASAVCVVLASKSAAEVHDYWLPAHQHVLLAWLCHKAGRARLPQLGLAGGGAAE